VIYLRPKQFRQVTKLKTLLNKSILLFWKLQENMWLQLFGWKLV